MPMPLKPAPTIATESVGLCPFVMAGTAREARLPPPVLRSARTLAILAAVCGVVAFGGCGGSSDEAASPLDGALGYLPEDAPFVVAIGTDPDGDQIQAARAILDRFPFGGQIEEQLDSQLGSGNVDLQRDVVPLLGNEFVVGVVDAKTFVGDGEGEDEFVAAIQANDGERLTELIERDGPEEVGEVDGATLYEDSDGDAFAIDGETLVVAGTRELLEGALAQRDADDRLTEEAFGERVEGLPEDAAVRATADLQALIEADPDTMPAREVAWVAALRDFGVSASLSEDAIDLDFRIATDGDLAEEDLPLAAGGESPPVLDADGELGIGLRGLAQIVRFGESTAQTVDPSAFGEYNTAKETIERQLDLSIDDDLLAQLEGDLSVTVAVGGDYGVRSQLEDPRAFEDTLERLAPVLPDILESSVGGPVELRRPGGGRELYELSTPSGAVAYGVVDDTFVLANDPRRAASLAGAPTVTPEGAEGSIALRADAEELATQVLAQLGTSIPGGALGSTFVLGPLGEVTGSVATETDGITGNLRLTFDG